MWEGLPSPARELSSFMRGHMPCWALPQQVLCPCHSKPPPQLWYIALDLSLEFRLLQTPLLSCLLPFQGCPPAPMPPFKPDVLSHLQACF